MKGHRVVVLGGYGEMGRAVTVDLAETCRDCLIDVAGRDKEKAESFAASLGRRCVVGLQADVNNHKQLVNTLKGADIVINATQYNTNLQVMRAALEAGVHYLDLGGLFHVTIKQLEMHSQFKRKRLVAVVGCGSTPGITNVMAEYGSRAFDSIREIHVDFADADFTRYRQPFVLPYSIYTLFDELTMKPAVFSKGRLKMVEPMSGLQMLEFPRPVGRVEGFYMLHSELATFPSSFRDKGVRECSFRATFPREFRERIKCLTDLGFASDREIEIDGVNIRTSEFTSRMMSQWLPKRGTRIDDLEYVRVRITGTIGGKRMGMYLYCLAKSNRRWNIPAGAYDTGVPASIVAQMIAGGQVRERGVFPPELCIAPRIFFNELRKRGISVSARWA